MRDTDRSACSWALAPWLNGAVLACIVIVCSTRIVEAQAQVRRPTQPILVLNTGGHHAPVRAIVFHEGDGSQLLTAGFDKVVNEWNVEDGRLRLVRTIRPPIWRGPSGMIYAMALSPPEGGQSQRTLAVAGYGLESTRGNIGLYRYPGLDVPTGDIQVQLPGGVTSDPEPRGHSNTVMALAFSPAGRYLASASMDATVRIWDYKERRTVAVLRDHAGAVNALAFTRDGQRLVTGGADGVVRLWDVRPQMLAELDRANKSAPDPARRRAVAEDFNRRMLLAPAPGVRAGARPNNPAVAINTLAVSPDPGGRWVVIGREDGRLIRDETATLAGGTILNPQEREQGAVEALAFSPDGKRLVTSIVSHRLGRSGELPRVECDVEIRDMPSGGGRNRVLTASNLVYACTFSPDGRYLAFAGGDTQSVYLKDLRDPARPLEEARGLGRDVRDVGFSADGRSVGYSRLRPDLPEALGKTYEGMNLSTRGFGELDPEQLRRALPTLAGWTIRPADPLTLDVIDRANRGYQLKLDGNQDRRWWSYSFIPTGRREAPPTVAIGCEGGVVIFAYDAGRRTYVRTRYFAGHSGAVYAVAPSPDGKWLVTGGSDQTVRLWLLAGCETPAPLGAEFDRERGTTLTKVMPMSFAEGLGLREGDRIETFYIGGRPLSPKDFHAQVDRVPPDVRIEFLARRGADQIGLGTTKRDAPALSLFPGYDREWVLWMPEGYYDTSPAGDQRHLGWHLNARDAGGVAADLNRPTEFLPIGVFERELRQKRVLDMLLETGDPARALALAPRPGGGVGAFVMAERPPGVRILEPAAAAGPGVVTLVGRDVTFRIRAESNGSRPIRSLRLQIDGDRQHRRTLGTFEPPRADPVEVEVKISASPGLHHYSVSAANDNEGEGVQEIDLYLPEPARTPQLVVISLAAEQFRGHAAAGILYADDDGRDVSKFLVAPGGRPRFERIERPKVLVGDEATAEGFRDALGTLAGRLDREELGPGDTVIVVIETHFLASPEGGLLAGSDLGGGMPPRGAIPAAEVASVLGRLADYGCRVVLLLDLVHEKTPMPGRGDVNEWVRDLYLRRNVITLVASNDGPSERLGPVTSHGVFSHAILELLDPAAHARPMNERDLFTLGGFQEVVIGRVRELTSDRQFAACYARRGTPGWTPILSPGPPIPRAP